MNSQSRACVAGICASMKNGRPYSWIYDYDRAGYASVSAQVRGGVAEAYDYERSCYVSGSLPSGLYDYGTRTFIELAERNGRVEGYDYGSMRHFEATVTGHSVTIYDYATSRWHNYQAS